MRRRTLLGLIGTLATLVLLLPGAASAAAPGKIAFTSDRDGDDDIFVMNADGSGQTPLSPNAVFNDFSPNWSPDAKQILFTSNRGGGADAIWIMNADGSGPRQLTNSGLRELQADWSPDGSRIVFTRQISPGQFELFMMNADGSGQVQLTNSPGNATAYGGHFSPDGQWIVFTMDGPSGNDDVGGLIRPDGSGQTPLTALGLNVYSPDFTSDGKRIVFWSDSDGDRDVYSMAVNGTDIRNLTNSSADSEDAPHPSRDGLDRIAFRSNRNPPNDHVFLMNADGSGVAQLTFFPDEGRGPNWQPTAVCQGRVATIVGTAASEVLTGGPNADIISGQGGDDQINGVDGDDVICGDAGKDKVAGGNGKDLLDGGAGKDKLTGGKGKDRLLGGKGKDKLVGGKGKDACIGGKGKDTGKSCEKEKKIP
jgi:Ca2+-binding RTX toxin-like protein